MTGEMSIPISMLSFKPSQAWEGARRAGGSYYRCKTRMNKKDSEQASPGEDPKGLKEQKVEMAAKPPGA